MGRNGRAPEAENGEAGVRMLCGEVACIEFEAGNGIGIFHRIRHFGIGDGLSIVNE